MTELPNTSVDNLLSFFQEEDNETQQQQQQPEPNDPLNDLFDFSLTREMRMDALTKLLHTHPTQAHEIIRKLLTIYFMSPLKSLGIFIDETTQHHELPLELRLECISSLCDQDKTRHTGHQRLDECIDTMKEHNISVTRRLDYILLLIQTGDFAHRKETLYEFLNDTDIDETFRFCSLCKLKHNTGNDIMVNAMNRFIACETNSHKIRILVCQHIMFEEECVDKTYAEEMLVKWMEDDTLDERIRADCADVLLRTGKDDHVMRAHDTLKQLGGEYMNIYQNKENAHTYSIEQSVRKTIEYLETIYIDTIPSFDEMKSRVLSLAEEHDYDRDAISHALMRIQHDSTIFEYVNHTLCSVALLVFGYIQIHQYKDEMERILLEEIYSMSGTCSTGYINRLVNVLSGYDNIYVGISWEEQIAANLTGRLNAKLREEDEEVLDKILEQMTNIGLEDRSDFFRFFRQHISSIREEMYMEFREYMSDADWDLWFMRALVKYQS